MVLVGALGGLTLKTGCPEVDHRGPHGQERLPER